MRRRLLPVVVLFFVSACPAFGETTGNDVLDSCQAALRLYDSDGGPTKEHFDGGWCFGWVAGALELTKLHKRVDQLREGETHDVAVLSPFVGCTFGSSG